MQTQMHTAVQIKLQDIYHGATMKSLKQYMTGSKQTLVSWSQSRVLLPDKSESLLKCPDEPFVEIIIKTTPVPWP